jgi:hypothetical protein
VAGRILRRGAVGDGARHLTLRPNGAELWVALGSSAAEIAVLDVREPARPSLAGRVRVGRARVAASAHDACIVG